MRLPEFQDDCFSLKLPSGNQNRRQKVFSRGLYVSAGELDIPKFTKTPLIYSVSYFNLRALGALFERAKSTKAPPPSQKRDNLVCTTFSFSLFCYDGKN